MLLRTLKWTYIISCVVLVGLLTWMGRRPLCIESRVVSKIDILKGGEQETVYRCGYNKEVKYSPFIWSQLNRINRAIFRVERYDLWFKNNLKNLYIYLDFDNPKVFVNTGSALRLGIDLFNNDVWLDRSFLKGVLGQHLSQAPTVEDRVSMELLVDLLLYLRGRPVPLDTENDDELLRWPSTLQSISGYCKSAWVMLEHLNFCSQSNLPAAAISMRPTDLSLHALFSQALKEALMEMQVNERLLIFQRMSLSMDHIEDKWRDIASRSNEDVDFEGVKDRFRALSDNFSVIDVLLKNWDVALLKRGYDEKSKGQLKFDVVLDLSSYPAVSDRLIDEVLKASRGQRKTLALKHADKIWVMPHRDPIELDELSEIHSETLVRTQCHLPSFKEAAAYVSTTKHLMVVQDCSEVSKIKFNQLMTSGIDGFAEENRTLSFVAFHLPSLVSPTDQVLNEMHFRFEKTSPGLRFVESVYGWKQVIPQPATGAYKVLSDVDAIPTFRAPPGFMLTLDSEKEL